MANKFDLIWFDLISHRRFQSHTTCAGRRRTSPLRTAAASHNKANVVGSHHFISCCDNSAHFHHVPHQRNIVKGRKLQLSRQRCE